VLKHANRRLKELKHAGDTRGLSQQEAAELGELQGGLLGSLTEVLNSPNPAPKAKKPTARVSSAEVAELRRTAEAARIGEKKADERAEALHRENRSLREKVGELKGDKLALRLVRTDGGTQPRGAIDEATVADYAAALERQEEFPPVVVFHDGVAYWLADGFHRFLAHQRAGRRAVRCDVRQGTRRDAVLYSVGANAEHGLKRSNDDKRRAVLTLLDDGEWGKWSDREIGRRCRVDHKTVASLRASPGKSPVTEPPNGAAPAPAAPPLTAEIRSEDAPESPSPAVGAPAFRTYTTRHGTTATMDTGKIGKRARPATAKPTESPVVAQAREVLAGARADELQAVRAWIDDRLRELAAAN
jgi:ParB-like chromosome segregation protein Spo0J